MAWIADVIINMSAFNTMIPFFKVKVKNVSVFRLAITQLCLYLNKQRFVGDF